MELLPEDVKSNIYRAKHEIEYAAVTEELEECFIQARMKNLVGILQPIAPRNGAVKLNLNIHSVKCSSAEILLCLLYTSPSPRDGLLSRMPSSA